MMSLAKTYREMFPTIFDSIYSKKNYTFGHSQTKRTTASCKAFTFGLFGSENSVNIPMINANVMLKVRYKTTIKFLYLT